MTLGKRIAEHRKRLGLTQDQLAEQLGVTAQAVSKWENDQSCPDITTLPRLADIFGTSVDALLGRDAPVHHGEVIDNDEQADGLHIENGKWNLQWHGSHGVGFAVFVLLTGILFLISSLLSLSVSFWNILWPTALLCFGIFGLLKKFSFFRCCCALLGGWFLCEQFHVLPFQLDGNTIWAVILLISGISLLIDALSRSRKSAYTDATYTDLNGKVHHGKQRSDFELEENSFVYHGSFGENMQTVILERMDEGEVHCSFGDYVIDLSGVEQVGTQCELELHCSFGELRVLVPKRFCVKPVSSTAFAGFSVSGQPESVPAGVIHMESHCSFGEISVEYI